MTDEEFNKFVLDELRTLVSDLEADCTPSNICLMEVVTAELMKQEKHK